MTPMTTRHHLLGLFTVSLALQACDSDLTFVPPDTDVFVVQAFLFSDEPVSGFTVTGVLPIDADATAVAEPISDAQITLIRRAIRYDLIATPAEPGRYHYPNGDLTVTVGDVFSLEVTRGQQVATAETVVPIPPTGLELSSDSLIAPTLGGPGQGPGGRGGGGGRGGLLNGITASWSNSASELHFVVIDNTGTEPGILPTTELFSRFARRIVQAPTAADSSIVSIVALTHYGQHRLKLYRVNDEYADLYEGLDQDSRDLNEPPSNIRGALGVFSAFSADSVFFEVR